MAKRAPNKGMVEFLKQVLDENLFTFTGPFFDYNRACSLTYTYIPRASMYVGIMGLDDSQMFWVVPWEKTKEEDPVTRCYDLADPEISMAFIRTEIMTEINAELARRARGPYGN